MKKFWGLVVVIVLLGVGLWLYTRLSPSKPTLTDVDGDSALDRIAEANGALEDLDMIIGDRKATGFSVAEPIYRSLIEQLPGELLPVRNLAVLKASQALVEDFSGEARQTFLQEAETALNQLNEVEGQQAVVAYLRSRILFKLGGEIASQPALDAINEAVSKESDNAMFWGWKAMLLETIRDGEPNAKDWKQERIKALARAWELDPTNVYILSQRLDALVESEDDEVLELIQEAKRLLPVLRYPVLVSNPQTDPFPYLERLESQVQEGDWRSALGTVGRLGNLIRNSLGIFNLESNRASGHPLDLMLHSPSERFFTEAKLSKYVPPTKPIRWSAGGPESLLSLETSAIDVVVTDVNVDKRLDLAVLTETTFSLWVQQPDGGYKADLTLELDVAGAYQNVLAVDLDQDDKAKAQAGGEAMGGPEESIDYFLADPDFVLWGTGGLAVALNLDDKGINRRLEWSPLPDGYNAPTATHAVVAGDFDFDADIDLVTSDDNGNHLLLNRGSGEFLGATQLVQLPKGEQGSRSMVLVDWDRDLDLDVLTTNGQELGVLENMLQGRLRYRPLSEIGPIESPESVFAVEIDGHPSWDLAIGQNEGGTTVLTQTHQSKVTETEQLSAGTSWTPLARFEDLDNDGIQDAIDLVEAGIHVSQGESQSRFEDPKSVGFEEKVYGFEVVDWDEDGRLDLVAATKSGISWLKNTTETDSGYVSLHLIGDEQNTGRIPRDAYGSMAELNVYGRYQAKMVKSQTTHFGLGNLRELPSIRVLWSNGMPQSVVTPARDANVYFPIYLKGSCPFLYTWDGEKFVFVTDCLWAAPLGLLQNREKLVPSREWEYLKVPGDLLQLNDDGQYQIQLTEELWEAAYFDKVELIAIDHPSEVEIYTNEKVGPPFISQYQVHAVQNRLTPRSAIGTQGQDVLEQVFQADDVYYQGFQNRVVQGLVDEHWLELDLGDLSEAKQVTLFLTGWIHPTDTSLNVSFTDHPDRNSPRLPELWVVNEQGQWDRWDAPIGFPGGKTKTIAIDLSELCPRPDGRLRIVTTAEIYWDEAFYVVDPQAQDFHEWPMSAKSAHLHYRGFSAREKRGPRQPEIFDYARVTTTPKWGPMQGRFTRYGDVTQLLQAADDRMVVMGSGDEMTVSFDPPRSDIPPGWKRDFFLHCVGWDKDADLNTILGQSTEPMPFNGMTRYPYADNDKNWKTSEFREYFSDYQTRRSSWGKFWKSSYWNLLNEPSGGQRVD